MYILYTPSRQLIGGSDGKLEFSTMTNNRVSKAIIAESKSLDGTAIETVLHRTENTTTVSTIPITGTATRNKFREFAASVSAGESFTIDVLGTEAVPVDAISVSLHPNSFKESYHGALIFSYSFKFRE